MQLQTAQQCMAIVHELGTFPAVLQASPRTHRSILAILLNSISLDEVKAALSEMGTTFAYLQADLTQDNGLEMITKRHTAMMSSKCQTLFPKNGAAQLAAMLGASESRLLNDGCLALARISLDRSMELLKGDALSCDISKAAKTLLALNDHLATTDSIIDDTTEHPRCVDDYVRYWVARKARSLIVFACEMLKMSTNTLDQLEHVSELEDTVSFMVADAAIDLAREAGTSQQEAELALRCLLVEVNELLKSISKSQK